MLASPRLDGQHAASEGEKLTSASPPSVSLGRKAAGTPASKEVPSSAEAGLASAGLSGSAPGNCPLPAACGGGVPGKSLAAACGRHSISTSVSERSSQRCGAAAIVVFDGLVDEQLRCTLEPQPVIFTVVLSVLRADWYGLNRANLGVSRTLQAICSFEAYL